MSKSRRTPISIAKISSNNNNGQDYVSTPVNGSISKLSQVASHITIGKDRLILGGKTLTGYASDLDVVREILSFGKHNDGSKIIYCLAGKAEADLLKKINSLERMLTYFSLNGDEKITLEQMKDLTSKQFIEDKYATLLQHKTLWLTQLAVDEYNAGEIKLGEYGALQYNKHSDLYMLKSFINDMPNVVRIGSGDNPVYITAKYTPRSRLEGHSHATEVSTTRKVTTDNAISSNGRKISLNITSITDSMPVMLNLTKQKIMLSDAMNANRQCMDQICIAQDHVSTKLNQNQGQTQTNGVENEVEAEETARYQLPKEVLTPDAMPASLTTSANTHFRQARRKKRSSVKQSAGSSIFYSAPRTGKDMRKAESAPDSNPPRGRSKTNK